MQPTGKAAVPFRTQTGVYQVTRDEILAAMREFDLRFRSNEDESGTLYAVEEGGKLYPPKRILELATTVPGISSLEADLPTMSMWGWDSELRSQTRSEGRHRMRLQRSRRALRNLFQT